MYVLVATPCRIKTPPVLLYASEYIYEALTYPHRERALMPNNIPPVSGVKYGTNAIARNLLIADYLKDYHTHVLWVDVDLVVVQPDIIEQLAGISDTDIVAPHVYIERLHPAYPPSMRNGGWFYDTGGFIRNGKTQDMWRPDLAGTQEVESVGCCYLLPADVYRRGCTYEPEGDEVEHVSFMRQARALGYKVWTSDRIIVEHAYLPKYGVNWTT